MVVYDEDGIEALGYHCIHCGQPPAVFLLAYLEDPEETFAPESVLAAPGSVSTLVLSAPNS
jgi:hypothetical protein